MNTGHKDQNELRKELEEAKTKVTIGTKYHHYKSQEMIYEVNGLGFFEANDEICVIYQTLYGDRLTFVRPLNVWLEEVEWEGKTVPRFTKI